MYDPISEKEQEEYWDARYAEMEAKGYDPNKITEPNYEPND